MSNYNNFDKNLLPQSYMFKELLIYKFGSLAHFGYQQSVTQVFHNYSKRDDYQKSGQKLHFLSLFCDSSMNNYNR